MRRIVPLLLLSLLAAWPGRADTVTLPASQDSTIYENFGDSGNGTGEWFFTSVTNTGAIRRGLIQFDLSAIPPFSQIESVSLQLTLSRFGGGTPTVGLHRITESWTEGGTNSDGQEGSPDLATTGDVTWQYRSFPTVEWTSQGGNFLATPSATLSIPAAAATYTWASNAALVADVQSWVDSPQTNFGWLLKVGSESGRRSRRFNSRSNGTSPPQLNITYTPTPIFSDGFESGDTSGWSITEP